MSALLFEWGSFRFLFPYALIHAKSIPKAIALTLLRSFLSLMFSLGLTLAALPASAADKPVKVYILSGQSNM